MSYIPFKKNKENKPLILIRENKNIESDNSILFESAHAFDEQYKWAFECAELVYNGFFKW